MHTKSNNEISREILSFLQTQYPNAVKFMDLVKDLDIDEKVLFKNLFFLEENSLVQLMSSYPTGATYPTIHMVKIREEGLDLLKDQEKLDSLFPLKGFSSRLDLYKINSITLSQLLEAAAYLIEKGEIRVDANREETLMNIRNFANHPAISKANLGKLFEIF